MSQNAYYRLIFFILLSAIIAGCGGSKTTDKTAPKFVYSSPANGIANVPNNSEISAIFSEGVNVSSFTVTSQNGSVIGGTVSGNGSSTITFTPAHSLNFGTKYTAKITGILDGSGNNTADVTWSFTTTGNSLTYHATPDSHFYNVGQFNSIAVSPVDGRSYMSYFNTSTRSLYVISTADGTSFEGPFRVDAPTGIENVGEYSSLAIDAAGNFHVSYYHAQSGLKYATAPNAAGVWTTMVVDGGGAPVGRFTSIALDANGRVHISYYDLANTALKYATNATGTWGNEIVDTGLPQDNPGQYTSIKVGAGNVVHISYYDFHASIVNGNLKYVTGTSGNWVAPLTLDSTGDVGQFSSLALFNGKVYITFNHLYPDGHRFIRIITNASDEWKHLDIVEVSQIVNDPTSLTANPIVIDATGIVYVSYYKGGVLYYTTGILINAAANLWDWASPFAVDTSELGQGIYTSLALSQDGRINIAYYDATDGDLKFAE